METIGDFEYNTKDLIGHGAFAVVYKGRQKSRNTLVAIKSITKKNLAKSQNLLGKEIKILKELTELHHENVVALLDCKETAHHVYLVMEFCNGGDLADYLHVKGTLSEDTIRSFLRQIAGAMRALYQKGVVHRDLKPQNILLCYGASRVNPPPSEIVLKIADFGFARFLQDGVMAATLCGSPMYMAPEVIMSLQYDAKADLWSIGTIVFQCLTGKAPFQAQTPQALKQYYEKNANLVPKVPSDTSPDLTNLLLRLLKRNAKDRMEFDEFFNHPFLKPVTKLSSPMPVPHRRGSSPLVAAGLSPTDVLVSPRLSSWSENPASPQNNYPQPTCNPRVANTTQVGDGGTLSSPDEQDFVFIPESCVSNETSGGNICEISSHSATNANAAYTVSNASNHRSASRRDQHRNAEPVPVPTQKEAYEQIQRSLAQDVPLPQASPTVKSKSPVTGSPVIPKSRTSGGGLHESSSSSSLSSERSRGIPDLTSISPPSIQFVIGTPPGGRTRSLSGSRSSSGTTPPPSSFLPGTGVIVNPGYLIHQSSGLGAAGYIRRNSLVRMNGNPVLSPILDFQQNNLVVDEEKSSPISLRTAHQGGWSEPSLVPFTSQKRHANDSYGSNLNQEQTSPQNPPPFQVAFGSGRAFTLPDMSPHNQQNFWPAANGTENSLSENRRQRRCQRNQSESHLALSSGVSPPHSISRCSSLPSNNVIDGPLTFVAPELSEETLFEREHNETLAKLNFVLALVDCILELAESKATPFGVLAHSANARRDKSSRQDSHVMNEQQRANNQANNSPASSPGFNPNATSPVLMASNNATVTGNPASDSYKRAEQLVLYMRALQLLSSSLQLSRQEVQAGKLRASASVRSVLKTMKGRFHLCLETCKALDSPTLLKGVGVDPLASSLTADRLLYDHAIEMCQSAALKELFGNPEECFHHYQTAQILLHSLAQQVEFDDDRRVLLRYKDAVEKRLFVLQSQGLVCAYDATT